MNLNSNSKQRANLCVLILPSMLLLSCTRTQVKQNQGQLAPRIGVCTSINNAELLEANGYDYVEDSVRRFLIPESSDMEFSKNLSSLEASSLPIMACNLFIPGKYKSTGPDIKHHDILKYAETAFTRAQKCGIKIIVFGSGGSRRVPDGFDPDMARKQFISLLKQMGPIAARYDVTVVIEPLHKGQCNFINTVSEGTDIARAVNHANIKVLADFYHMAYEKEGPESILKAGKDLKHCHIAELKKRAAPGVHGDDFTGYLQALKEINYKGLISIECHWKDLEKEAPVAIQTLKEQIQKVNELP